MVTDLVSTHALWFDKRADLILVPTEQARQNAIQYHMLPEKVRVALDSLKTDEISAPVRDGEDFTLFRVDDRKAQRKLTIEDDYNLLADKTREISMQKKLFDLVKKWRQDVFVEERL